MPLLWFSFFHGVAIVGAVLVFGDALELSGDAFPSIVPAILAIGIALRVRPDEGSVRCRAVPRGHALFAMLAVAVGAALIAIFHPGPAIALVAVAASAMIGFGRASASFFLFLGVQKVKRLHLGAALVSGVACGYAATRFLFVPELGMAGALIAAVLPWAALSFHPRVAQADFPAPEREAYRLGITSTLGVFLVGVGLVALMTAAAVRARVSFADPLALAAFFASPLFAVALGAWALTVKNPRSRRAAMLIGAGSLFAVAVYGFEMFYAGGLGSEALRRSMMDQLGIAETPGHGDEARLGLALLGAPCFLLGAGLVTIVRLYGGLPMGRKLVRHLPPSERRPLSGAPLRAAALVAGIPVAQALMARGRLGQHGALLAMIAGGLALIASDPRAGFARKLGMGCIAGGLAVAGLWMAW